MKKRIILGIIIAALTIGVVAWIALVQPNVFLSTTSPNGIYTVELTGNKSSPSLPFFDHKANFNLFKKGQPLVKNAYVKVYDWFDSGFSEMYPEHKWESESVMRFGSNVAKTEKRLDSLVVSNRTNKTVKYLKITAGDMIFVFEMPPNSTSKFSVPYLGDLPWVASEGEFADGQQIQWDGVNFFHKDKSNQPLQYCLSVNDGAIRIKSPTMEGYNGSNIGSEKPNVPKVADCSF